MNLSKEINDLLTNIQALEKEYSKYDETAYGDIKKKDLLKKILQDHEIMLDQALSEYRAAEVMMIQLNLTDNTVFNGLKKELLRKLNREVSDSEAIAYMLYNLKWPANEKADFLKMMRSEFYDAKKNNKPGSRNSI